MGACILTPHRARVSRGRLVTTVRELRDFLFGPIWHPSPTSNRPGDWERVRAAALNASDLWLPLENGDLWRAVAVRKIPPADYRPEYLDRQVICDVELPDGAAHGPVIDRLELARLRLVSRAEVPGVCRGRIPSPGGRASPADATPATAAFTCGAPTPHTTPFSQRRPGGGWRSGPETRRTGRGPTRTPHGKTWLGSRS